jgi:hypothetical protein
MRCCTVSVDEQPVLGRAEAEPIRLLEQVAVDQELRRSRRRRDAVDALEAELPRPLDAVDRHSAVPGIGEVDRPVGLDADIVWAVSSIPSKCEAEPLAGRPAARARGSRSRARRRGG